MAENLLQLQDGMKCYGSRQLFQNAGFSLNADEHVGVIGPNGAGKTTLFRILIGEEQLDSGTITRAKKLSVGYLSQHDHWNQEETGNSYLERTTKIPLWELKAQGRVLQVSEQILEQKITSLSGGYRMRIKLLALLGQAPNLMLLDEPTNYLDLETTLVLERFLQSYEGAFLLISHDREFLRRTTDHTLEVEAGEITKYNGNIDDYFEQKELLRTQLMAQAAGQQAKRQAILDFVARFGAKATKAKQAQSRLKSLAKMETIEVKSLPISSTIRIPTAKKTGKITLEIADASFGYGEKTILRNVSLQVARGDHVAVVGLNGAGKSTLLKGISGTLPPQVGEFKFGFDVEIAFFAQHVVESLSLNDTVQSALERAAATEITPQEIKDLAGSLLFSGDDIKKRISVLSGGERSRVALGKVLLQKASCLVLDEPTNHLDFQTVEALTNALCSYPGTVIVVSHDRGFIKRVGTKILEVSRGGVHLYPGTYEEYVWRLQQSIYSEERIPDAEKKVLADTPTVPKAHHVLREQKKQLEKDLRSAEKKLAECEKELASLSTENEELNKRLINEYPPDMACVKKMSENGARIEELEAAWLSLSEEKEKFTRALIETKS